MRKAGSAHGDQRQLRTYFLLAYALSWVIAIPLALREQGVIPPILPLWLHYLVGYGPMLSALIVGWSSQGRPGINKLLRSLIKWRVHSMWWLAALSPLLIGLVAAILVVQVRGTTIDVSVFGQVNFLPPLGLGALVLWLLTFGVGEEVGWRGFALPYLQRRYSALSATLILGALWALWHLPQFFYLFEPAIAVGWLFGLFAGAVVFTWLYNSSGGSVLLAAIWHSSFNFMTASNAGDGIVAAVVTIAVMVGAVIVVLFCGPRNLSARERVVW